jgi:hypothetical protein
MSTITATSVSKTGSFAVTEITATDSDVIAYDSSKKQILLLDNSTSAAITATIKGATATSTVVAGIGTVDLSAGISVTVAAGATLALMLSTVSLYLSGDVTMTGGTGLTASLLEI